MTLLTKNSCRCSARKPAYVLVVWVCLLWMGHLHAQVKSVSRKGNTVRCTLAKGLLEINVIKEDVVEIRYTLLDTLPAKQSLIILPQAYQKTELQLEENKTVIQLHTPRLTIAVNRITAAIRYADAQGKPVLEEAGAAGKFMKDTTVAGMTTYACGTLFQSPVDEALFGLGCHPLDSLSINYKGRNQDMAIQYLTGAIPVLLSTKGYGLLWDNYAASKFYGALDDNTRYSYVSESGREVDYYFFYGPDFDHIIGAYRQLTGPAPMFPKWAFGLFQSQDRYKSQAEVLFVKDQYRKNHIPVDAIVQDWYYWEPLPIGSHVLLPERYPDPKAMVDALHQANLHAMISIWPVFGTGTPNFDALKKAGFLTNITWDNAITHSRDTYYDAHNPQARELYWQQARDSLVARAGWDAWWVDQCEPDTEDPNDRKKSKFYTGKGLDFFNTYALEHSTGIYQKWRRDIPGKRIFLLTRQAFAGQQRNATTLWSSDITCTFASYKNQVPQAINACAAGIPYWTSDIGGYHWQWQAPDWSAPANRELFTRWFQFGTFSPIFRIHGKGERALFSSNWDDSTRLILLQYDRLRYRLLPYIYSLAAQVTQDNYTILRSLAFDFRNDTAVYNLPDQYMFGPALLVNPVTQQLYTGAGAATNEKSRKVYLPRGTAWYDFWTGKKIKGGQVIAAPAPMNIIPLYVREGAILPMGRVMEYATEQPADTIDLRIYPGQDGHFTYYEDENDNYAYEKGKFATFRLSWADKTRELSISATSGAYPGMPKRHVFNVLLVNQQQATGMDTFVQTGRMVRYKGMAMKIKIQ